MMTRLSIKNLKDNNYTRHRRNIPLVNYAGMDNDKEDHTDLDYVPDNNLFPLRRSPRNLKRINYAGMDNDKEDEL